MVKLIKAMLMWSSVASILLSLVGIINFTEEDDLFGVILCIFWALAAWEILKNCFSTEEWRIFSGYNMFKKYFQNNKEV